jgi:hypothetical protein
MLQDNINVLLSSQKNITMVEYILLMKECVDDREFKAAVFVYDHILSNKLKPPKDIYDLLDKLHSKTLKNNDTIIIQSSGRSLDPRRRIHKIMKGYNYSDNYTNALQHLDKVKVYLNSTKDVPSIENKNKLAKHISVNCNICIKDAKYIVTNLKRTKFFNNPQLHNTITNYFK